MRDIITKTKKKNSASTQATAKYVFYKKQVHQANSCRLYDVSFILKGAKMK